MSDPVTNVEIEDVLASIRRLVSDEPPEPVAAKDKVEKLVLTPALRVNNDVQPGQSPVVKPATSDTSASGQSGSPAAMTLGAEYAVAPAPTPKPAMAEPVEDEAPNAAETLDRLEGMQAALSANPDLADDQWEPEGDEDDDAFAMPNVSALDWVDHTPQESLDAGEADFDEAPYCAVETEDAAEVHSLHGAASFAAETTVDPSVSEDAVEAPEVEATEEAFAPLEAEIVDEAPSTHEAPSFDGSVEETAEEPATAQVDAFSTAAFRDAALEELAAIDGVGTALDEEALRELVTEIVRQELQGSLGERITRNVRKLVRREIQRALTAHNLQ